jgi:hypothetical protein
MPKEEIIVKVRALTQHIYAGINHEAGEIYDAPEDRLAEIIGFGWVTVVEPKAKAQQAQPPTPEPKLPPGAYETREMKPRK